MPFNRYFLELAGFRMELPASEGMRLKRYIDLGWADPSPCTLVVEPI